MTFRLDPERYGQFRAKIQFTTSAEMPSLIYRACLATGFLSNTVYCQHALCQALARDLDIPLADLLDHLPTPRGPAAHLYDPALATMNRYPITAGQSGGRLMTGPANTIEDVK